ncbi:MAG: type II secretion system major pseudopilin GspG [Pseudomonadota bacterium]
MTAVQDDTQQNGLNSKALAGAVTDSREQAPKAGDAKKQAGFSLLELLIVLTIMAMMTAIVGPRLINQLDKGKITVASSQLTNLRAALKQMRIDLGRYPTEQEGLALLVTRPTQTDGGAWFGPYLDGDVPADPWGREFVYVAPTDPSGEPRIGTLGADGKVGGSGASEDVFVGGGPSDENSR